MKHKGGWSFTEYTPEDIQRRDGRAKIITDCFDKIQTHIDNEEYPYDLNVSYMKEKYGGLRVECRGCDDYVSDLLWELELKSEEVCNICGRKGKLRTDFCRWQTLCLRHYLPLKINQIWRRYKNKIIKIYNTIYNK